MRFWWVGGLQGALLDALLVGGWAPGCTFGSRVRFWWVVSALLLCWCACGHMRRL